MIQDGGRGSTKRGFCQQSGHPDDSKCCFIKKDDSKLFCCRCAHKRRASPLTCLAICFLVLTYNLLGGFLFLAIEGGTTAEETSVAASKPNPTQQAGGELRSQTVERLWSITEDLNILYKENWTKLAAKELMDFQKVLLRSTRGSESMHHDPGAGYRWTFSGSFLYALTLITTIGHGNVAPRSSAGRIAAVAYACVGIPIVMLYLSTIGEALARNFRILYSKICPARLKSDNFHSKAECLGRYSFPAFECRQYADCDKSDKHRDRQHATPFQAALNLDTLSAGYHWTCRDHTRVPILLSFVVVASYVILGTFVFHTTEKWDLIDGCYFSFSSLATIGFGNLKPGLHAATVSAKAEDVAVGVCCVYILVGIVVVAMCFNLVQEDAGAALRHVAVLCAGGGKSRAVHSAECGGQRPTGAAGAASAAGAGAVAVAVAAGS